MKCTDDGWCKRLCNIADSHFNYIGLGIGFLELTNPSSYFREKISGLKFEVVFVYMNHLYIFATNILNILTKRKCIIIIRGSAAKRISIAKQIPLKCWKNLDLHFMYITKIYCVSGVAI